MQDQDPLIQFKLMLPSRLKDAIANAAQAKRRSLSQEIVATLEEKYPLPEPGRDLLAVAISLALPDVRAATSDDEAMKAIEAGNEILAKANIQWRLVLTHAGDKRAIGFVDA